MKILSSDIKIYSNDLFKQINAFRIQEDRIKWSSNNWEQFIRYEFKKEIMLGMICIQYSLKRNQQNNYLLTKEQAKNLLVRESKSVRKSILNYIKKYELQINSETKLKKETESVKMSKKHKYHTRVFKEKTGDFKGRMIEFESIKIESINTVK